MSSALNQVRVIKSADMNRHEGMTLGSESITVAWDRNLFKLDMGDIRSHVTTISNIGDRDKGEFVYSQLMECCRFLQKRFGFKRAQ